MLTSRCHRRALLPVALTLIAAAAEPAAAQRLDIGAAYQYLSLSASGETETFPIGFNLDASVPLTSAFSAVGEVGWARRSESYEDLFTEKRTRLNFGGGLRWILGTSIQPWAQGILGAQRASTTIEFEGDDIADDSATDFLVGVDGGITLPVGGLHVFGAAGYRRIFSEDAGADGLRVLAGIRFGIGG